MEILKIINDYDEKFDEKIKKSKKLGKPKFKEMMIHRKISLVFMIIAIILVTLGAIWAGIEGNLSLNKVEIKFNIYLIVIGYLLILSVSIFNWYYENRPEISEKINKKILSYQKQEKKLENLPQNLLKKYDSFNKFNRLLVLKLAFEKKWKGVIQIFIKYSILSQI